MLAVAAGLLAALPVPARADNSRGQTICVSVGNGSNAELVSRSARLMLFDQPVVLPERLGDQTCTLAAQDDSFFDYYFADPSFAGRRNVFG
jgi:polar amino acid transport system substrate-binding protein